MVEFPIVWSNCSWWRCCDFVCFGVSPGLVGMHLHAGVSAVELNIEFGWCKVGEPTSTHWMLMLMMVMMINGVIWSWWSWGWGRRNVGLEDLDAHVEDFGSIMFFCGHQCAMYLNVWCPSSSPIPAKRWISSEIRMQRTSNRSTSPQPKLRTKYPQLRIMNKWAFLKDMFLTDMSFLLCMFHVPQDEAGRMLPESLCVWSACQDILK